MFNTHKQWVKNCRDKVGEYLHWKICYLSGIKTTANCYEDHPESIDEEADVTNLWGFSMATDRTIQANRIDITMKD